mgnify:FL=1
MSLWPHQARAVAETRRLYREGRRAPLIVLPTGGGKTRLARHYVSAYAARDQSVLWLAHRDELVGQATVEITRGEDGVPVERVTVLQGDRRPRAGASVTVATVQTLAARLRRGADLPAADLVVFDEARHYAAADWREVASRYDAAFRIGLDATPVRSDGSALGDLFDSLVVGATVRELQAAGVLCPARVIGPDRATDGLSMEPAEAVAQWAPRGTPCVVFAGSVAEAREIAEAVGDRAAYVDGSQPLATRRETLARFERGDVDVLVNVFLLTEGWDSPRMNAGDCTIVVARGCGSWSMWRQIIGRGMRVAAGPSRQPKTCTVVDLRGAVHAHGLPAEDVTFSLDGAGVTRPAAESLPPRCPTCWVVGEVGADRRCGACGALVPLVRERQKLTPERIAEIVAVETAEQKRAYLDRLRETASSKGYAAGWASHRYKAKYGTFPARGA